MRRFSEALSLLFAFIAIPACCVIEYFAGMKMGMYRYLVLKNAWLLKNIFTPGAIPYIAFGVIFILMGTLILFCRPVKGLWFVYGVFLTAESFYILRAETFSSLRAAPWFGLSVLLADIFFVLASVQYLKIIKYLRRFIKIFLK